MTSTSASAPPAGAVPPASASPAVPPAATAPPVTGRQTVAPEPVGFLRAPLARRTWSEYGYLWLVLLLAPFALTYTLFTVSFSAGVAVTVVGLFVGGALVVGARGWGAVYRGLARSLLATDVPDPVPFRRGRGFWRAIGSMVGDAAGWRALLFGFVTFPVTLAGFVLSTTFLAVSLGAMTHWFWSRWLPLQEATDGTLHRGAQFGTDWFVDTPERQAALAGAGLVLLFVWPWVQRVFVELLRLLTTALLAPTAASLRVADLERSRAGAVENADSRLRRIERDLHDGTQARLVAVAMQLGEAKEHLRDGGDPRQAAELVDVAHASAKDALTELRELARGIHPPALDSGLGVALETLAARAPLPVAVQVDLGPGARLAPALESIAYYCVAELVTNAAKHARASVVDVVVECLDGSLQVRVTDDGEGGAAVTTPDADGRRSGLAGLRERVGTVDGTLDVSSPAGGPTVVTVTLPTTTRPGRP
ncbi:sensor histidine kinase [Antribacter gilvus]|uniref:sensor histidine kinase n=1 Tax=Antribacter gilvus TaxID=2304675 RepID=UPI000F79D46E|nr:sensor histidine kinase [Antribacter gilvus]